MNKCNGKGKVIRLAIHLHDNNVLGGTPKLYNFCICAKYKNANLCVVASLQSEIAIHGLACIIQLLLAVFTDLCERKTF